jgi:UPF0716 protein FxsA
MRLLLLFLVVPFVEIALFVAIGGQVGIGVTLLWVLATGVLGAVLVRAEPQRSAQDVRQALAMDADPANPMAHSALRLLGALMLVIPGFLTDAIGALLLATPVRAFLLSRFQASLQAARPARDDVIEGEYNVQSSPDDATQRLEPSKRPDLRD